MENQNLIKLIEKIVKERVSLKVPHICSYCDWLRFNDPPTKPNNRYCKYPGEIKVVKGICQMWKLAEDMDKRVRGNYTV